VNLSFKIVICSLKHIAINLTELAVWKSETAESKNLTELNLLFKSLKHIAMNLTELICIVQSFWHSVSSYSFINIISLWYLFSKHWISVAETNTYNILVFPWNYILKAYIWLQVAESEHLVCTSVDHIMLFCGCFNSTTIGRLHLYRSHHL
jgi:hypothetical protein